MHRLTYPLLHHCMRHERNTFRGLIQVAVMKIGGHVMEEEAAAAGGALITIYLTATVATTVRSMN